MRQLFAPFGSISSIEIVKDAGGQSQGYGYVEFTSMPDASKAMQQWDGQEVVGQKLSVKIAPLAPGQAQTFAMPQLDLDDDEGQYITACARLAFLLKKACPQESSFLCCSSEVYFAVATAREDLTPRQYLKVTTWLLFALLFEAAAAIAMAMPVL